MQGKVSGARAGGQRVLLLPTTTQPGLGERERDTLSSCCCCGSSASLANNGFTTAQHRAHVKIMCLAHSENSRNISAGTKVLMF